MQTDHKLRIDRADHAPTRNDIEDPREAIKIAIDLIESATKEILILFSTANAFHRQEKIGNISRLHKVSKKKHVAVRILVPYDNAIKDFSNQVNKEEFKFRISFIEPTLTKISILIVDRIHSLVVELKDDSKETSYEAMGISTYSNSKAVVLSYSSIFESLWSTIDLNENMRESNRKLQQLNLDLSVAERRYSTLYDKSPILLRSITTDGVLTDCNEAYAKALGYTKEEAIGMSMYDHTAERSVKDLRDNVDDWLRTRDTLSIEVWLKRKDGSIFPTILNGTSLYDENGKLIGRTLALTNITERYEARRKLEENEARIRTQYDELKKTHELLTLAERRYRTLYDKSPILLRSITTDGVLTDCNEAYAKALGYTKEEAIGMSMYDHTAERSVKDLRDNLGKWQKTNKVTYQEIWVKRRDETIFPCLMTGASLFDEYGKVIGRTVALTDMTEIQQARLKIEEREALLRKQFEELKELNKKLELHDKMQKEFINVAAHELRSPIQPIIGLAESLRDREGDISLHADLIDILIKSGKRLQRLAENILDVTRIESNTFRVNKEKINIRELINDLSHEFYYELQYYRKENDIKLELEAKEDIFVNADRERLAQVVMNLYHNAIKFTDEGEIFISAEKMNGSVLVRVKDTGRGVSRTVLPQLFTKFTKSETGSGLGLFISKKIVEAHGGTISAENKKEGNGTTFTFAIPSL